MKNITIPSKLEPVVKAFFADSHTAAKALIIQAAKAIYGSNEDSSELECFDFNAKREITEEDLEGICAIMDGIKPQDMLEALYAAQIVVTHMLGLRKLAKSYINDQKMGLQLLKFSSESMAQLQKKRTGGVQNITVNYQNIGTGPTLMQTVIPNGTGQDAF